MRTKERRMPLPDDGISRREFVAFAGAAAAWPGAAHAQPAVRRIGVMTGRAEDDPSVQSWLAAFLKSLGEAGWVRGRNLQIEYRWTGANIARIGQLAAELVALKPDVILADATPVTAALKRATASIPIVFVVVSDPIGAGFVESLARPGGNLTGFLNLEDTMGGKLLDLLKEVAPGVTRAGIMFNPDTAPGAGKYFQPSFEMACRRLGVTPVAAPVRNAAEMERAIADLAAAPGGGLVTQSDSFLQVHIRQVTALAEAHKLPAVHMLSTGAKEGGLLSYSPDIVDMFGRSAAYVDRILKGERPADLPVQVPTKFLLIVNLKAAKACGLTVPPALLTRADEVIE